MANFYGSAIGFGSGGGAASAVTATGGTITISGDYKIHTFTSSGTFQVTALSASPLVDYLVVAGGAGGGGWGGGAGGAGGLRNTFASEASGGGSASQTQITATVISYTVTVGAGGAGVTGGTKYGGEGVAS